MNSTFKSILLLSLSTSVLLMSACSDDSTDDSPTAPTTPINPTTYLRLLTTEVDSNADFTADVRTTFVYNTDGTLYAEQYDNEADGAIDANVTYSYDSNQNVITEKNYTHPDSDPKSIITYTYNAAKDILTEAHDTNANQTVDFSITYTYQNAQKTTKLRQWITRPFPSTTTQYSYNPLLVLEELVLENGTTASLVAYTYDPANDNLLTKEDDYEADGTYDRIISYGYDVNGSLTTELHDDNADGIPEFKLIHTYDADLNLVQTITDIGDSGHINAITTYTWGNI